MRKTKHKELSCAGWLQVYDCFEEHLGLFGLRFARQAVQPATGFPGAPIGNRADVYEGGFRLYRIEHRSAPSSRWPQGVLALGFL